MRKPDSAPLASAGAPCTDRRQAQQAAEALQQALDDLGLPEDLVTEIEGRLRSQQKLLGKIVGMMCPPLFGCRTNSELCRVRGWDKNLPSRLLGALPKRSWIKRLRRLGLEVLVPLWRYAASKSEATRSRWQWTWVAMTRCSKSMGSSWAWSAPGGVGRNTGCSPGIDGVLLVVVIGDGKLVVPVDFAIRRPDPTGPGGPCRDKLHWLQGMLDGRVAAFADAAWRCLRRWLWPIAGLAIRNSCAMSRRPTRVPSWWKGRVPTSSNCPMGARSRGVTCSSPASGPGVTSPQVPGVRYARLRATSPTYGAVTIIVVDEPGVEQYLLDVSGD